MRGQGQNTPPSSIQGDELMDDEYINLDEMEEITLDDIEAMEEGGYEHNDTDEEVVDFEPSEDHAFMVFDKHVKDVFCCDIHPDGKIAVTGGIDHKAYVWSVATGEVIMECSDRQDSVIIAAFSFDGVYLAVIDMVGIIRVYKCNLEENQKDKWPLVFEDEAGDVIWGIWHPAARVLFVGSEIGDIYVYKIPTGEMKVLKGHYEHCEMGKVFHDGKRLVSGYLDGVLKIWDVKTGTILQQLKLENGFRNVDIQHDDSLLAVLSNKGDVFLITPNNGKIVANWDCLDNLEEVVFSKNPEFDLMAIGALNGSFTLWDTATKHLRYQCSEPKAGMEGCGSMRIIWIKDKVVTARLDGSVRAYDARSGAECMLLTGHRRSIFDMCYNKKANILLTVSKDGTARLYKCEFKTENRNN